MSIRKMIALTGVMAVAALGLVAISCSGGPSAASAAASPQALAAAAPASAVTTELKPAALEVLDLAIDPPRANPGEEVTVTAKVTNTGDVDGNFIFALVVDGTAQSAKKLSIPAGQSQTINSIVTKEVAGVHTVNAGRLQSRFEVIPVVTTQQPAQAGGLPSCCSPTTPGQSATTPGQSGTPGCCAPGAVGSTPTPGTPTPTPVKPKAGCCG